MRLKPKKVLITRGLGLVCLLHIVSPAQAGLFGEGCFGNSAARTPVPTYPYAANYAPLGYANTYGVAPLYPAYSPYIAPTYTSAPTSPFTPYNPNTIATNGIVTSGYATYPSTAYRPVTPFGVPQTVVGTLPTGAYQTQYYRAPTTYYRPVTSIDPATGATVTNLMPCQSYQYQAQRTPLLVPGLNEPYAAYNAAYGSYGNSWGQNRWSPITAPSVGSAGGQSTLSIPSGLGTSTPVVQLPANGLALSPTTYTSNYGLPAVQSLSPGYGGISYGPAISLPTSNSVVQATAMSPIISNVPATTFGTPTPNSSTTVIGSAPIAGALPPLSSMPGTMGNSFVPSSVSPTITTEQSILPTGPITSGPVTTNPFSTTQVFPSPQSSSSQPVLPPNYSNGTDSESKATPVLPPTSSGAAGAGQPSYRSNYGESSAANQNEDTTALKPRFGLRKIEIAPADQSSRSSTSGSSNNDSGEAYKPVSPWETAPPKENESESNDRLRVGEESTGRSSGSRTPFSNPSLMTPPNSDLQLSPESSMKPIPAPRDFDASPNWRPGLMTVRDQTAKVEPRAVPIDRVNPTPNDRTARSQTNTVVTSGDFKEVRYLNSVSPTHTVQQASSNGHSQAKVIVNDGNDAKVFRPAQRSFDSAYIEERPINRPMNTPRPSNKPLDTSGWTAR